MSPTSSADLEKFQFRLLHPQVKIGTASDRYAGWMGQIYSAESYHGRISQRTKVVGEKTFTEQVLPVESVAEYFEHFAVLEIDFTFYRPLIDKNGAKRLADLCGGSHKELAGVGHTIPAEAPKRFQQEVLAFFPKL